MSKITMTVEFASENDALAFLQSRAPTIASPAQVAPAAAPAPVAAPYAPQAPAAAPVYAPQPPVNAPAPAAVPYQAPAPAVAPAPAAPVADQSGGVTLAQLTAQAQAHAKVHTAKGTKAVYGQFGITKLSEAQPHQYPAILQALAA